MPLVHGSNSIIVHTLLLFILEYNSCKSSTPSKDYGLPVGIDYGPWMAENYTALMLKYVSVCGHTRICNTSMFDLQIESVKEITICPACACDPLCYEREDCCPDVMFAAPQPQCRETAIITDKSQSDQVLMIDTCPNSTDIELKEKCDREYDVVELIQLPPVVSLGIARRFRNKYCAVCNNVNNYTNLQVAVTCKEYADLNFLSSYKEIVDFALERNCYVGYNDKQDAAVCAWQRQARINFAEWNYIIMNNMKVVIKRCNVTGTWTEYDSDTDFVCQFVYLTNYYRHFRNIFCFICNPPNITQNPDVISECNQTDLWTPYDEKLLSACHTIQLTFSTFPFKNVFCMFCNRNNNKDQQYMDVLGKVSQNILSVDKKQTYVTYLMDVGSFDIEAFNAMLYRNMSSQFNDDTLAEQRDINTDGILRTQTGDLVNISKLALLDYSTHGMYTYCAEKLSSNVMFRENCSCDLHCFFQEESNCCADFKLYVPIKCHYDAVLSYAKAELSNLPIQYGSFSFAVVSGCLNSQSVLTVTRNCQNANNKDLYSLLPIMEKTTQVHFKNFYCYLCNNEYVNPITSAHTDFNSYLPYFISIACGSELNIDFHVEMNSVFKLAFIKGCAISLPRDGKKINLATKHFFKPSTTQKCNETGLLENNDHDIQWACEQSGPFSAVYEDFKNIYCSLCNPGQREANDVINTCNITTSGQQYGKDMIDACNNLPEVTTSYPYKNVFCRYCDTNETFIYNRTEKFVKYKLPDSTPGFRDLFKYVSFNRVSFQKGDSGMGIFEIVFSTDLERLYDPITGRTREISCFPGKHFVDRKCEPLLQVTFGLHYTLAFGIEGVKNPHEDVIDLLEDIVQFVKSDLDKQLNIPEISFNRFLNLKFDSFMISSNATCSNISANKSVAVEVFVYTAFQIDTFVNRQKTEDILIGMLNRNFTLYDDTYFTKREPKAFQLPYSLAKISRTNECFLFDQVKQVYDSKNYPRTVIVSQLFNCRQVELDKDEFVVNNMDSELSLIYTNKVLFFDEYYFINDYKIRICITDYERLVFTSNVTHKQPFNFFQGSMLNILTFSCTLVTLTCLVLTFATYLFIAKIRTVPGINIMCLVFAMFFAQGLFQFGLELTHFVIVCKVIGILTHYFWLCTFACMSVCSFHMYKVFASKPFLNLPSSTSQYKTVVYYIAYSYGIPAIIVASTAVSVYITSDYKDIGYGVSNCFLSDGLAFFVAFLTPVILVCVTNIYFFLRTAFAIRSAPTVQSTKERKSEFTMFIKMFTLTGFIWVFMMLDALQPISVFSYLITIMTGCQGLFIFVSYVCNKRVWSLLKARSDNETRHTSNKTEVRSKENGDKTTANHLLAVLTTSNQSSSTSATDVTDGSSTQL